PGMDMFYFRLENLISNGGFALISGEPGLGKSKLLQLFANRLNRLEDVTVGVMERPQSSLNDFYREMGSLFNVNLSPANRYGGFKALRERWNIHIKSTLYKPILLIDEAQEMISYCMNELRMMASEHFDSKSLLTVVMCGDERLPERFRSTDLVSLGSRMRFRIMLKHYKPSDLISYLDYALEQAGASHLMTQRLKETLAEHCAGNIRVLNNMAAELLAAGAQKQVAQLDEKLFLEIFSRDLHN
ncbi:ATP-binding protein, partial [Desulfobacterales bacterium HSG17]|nr:ATP-binding protein [Desulfobacterales bacterium HSG17]